MLQIRKQKSKIEKTIGHFKQKHKNGTHISCWPIHSTISYLYPKKYNKKKNPFCGTHAEQACFRSYSKRMLFFFRRIPNLYLKVTNQTSNWPYFLAKRWKWGLHECLASSTIYLCTKIPSSCGTHVRLTSLLLVFSKRILKSFTLVTEFSKRILLKTRTIVAVIYTVTVYMYVIIYSLSLPLSLRICFPNTNFPTQTRHQILHQYKPIVKTKPTKKNPHLRHSIATNIAIATTGASTNLWFTPKPSKTSSHYHQKWRKLSH